MALNQKENELHLYSINENEYIGAINATTGGKDTYRTIVLLDSSLPVATRFMKEILPLVISKVKNWHSSVRLITFGAESIEEYVVKTQLVNVKLTCGGAPNIGPAIEKLRLFLESCTASSRDLFDLLTISAGEISDYENAEQETKKLTDFLAKRNWRINSQAVRLFTTSNKPDTKALSYLLQINNSTAANICDINMMSTLTNETIANEIAALYTENDFRYTFLNVDKSIALRYPWTSFQSHIFIITKGWNIFWLKQLPTKDAVKIQDQPATVVVEGQLTLEKFQQLMARKLPQIVSHMTILKIVGTAEANEAVDQIFSYFAKTEDALAVKCSTPNNKIVTNALAEIAMYRPDFHDSTEMVEFHRNPTGTIEARKEEERRQREEEERLKREEEERLKREENERHKQEEDERLKRMENLKEEERLKREEAGRQKQEGQRLIRGDDEYIKQAEDERRKHEEEERVWREEAERAHREEEERLMRKEVLSATGAGKSIPSSGWNSIETTEVITANGPGKAVPTNNQNPFQMVFILHEHQSGPHISRRFTEEIVPLMLSKCFHENSQLVQLVTFLRHKATTAQTIQSLVQTLDATKRIRISVVADGEECKQLEIENFAETVVDFLSRSGYSFELQVVRLALSTPTTNGCKLVDVDAGTSSGLIAKSIA